MPRLRFLGSGDSQGVPRWWCNCPICQEARHGGLNRRTRPSVLIEGDERVLIDAAPELREQMVREGISGVDSVLITHAHNDHLLGLGDLGDRARWKQQPCPLYTPAEVLPLIAQRFAYMVQESSPYLQWLPMSALELAQRTFAGYRVRPVRVPHGFNGWSYAFRFDGEGGSWGYMSDCIGLKELEPWLGLDLLVLGTSFYQEEARYQSRSVYDVVEALELIERLQPRQSLFTHLGHGVDIRTPLPEGTAFAHDGLVVELP